MKLVILAGGLGTRLSEETSSIPKPMVEIGGKPILWHIMKMYSSYGINEFIICCGYKADSIKEYFANYEINNSDTTFDLKNKKITFHTEVREPWTVTLVDTGLKTMTGGRIKRIKKYVENDNLFCMTYGDGLSDVNIKNLIDFHSNHNALATVTCVPSPARFGAIEREGTNVTKFSEKSSINQSYINGGFFVLSPKVIELIDGDDTIWEEVPINRLVSHKQLKAFEHSGFWQPMDALREKILLQDLWDKDQAPWKIW